MFSHLTGDKAGRRLTVYKLELYSLPYDPDDLTGGLAPIFGDDPLFFDNEKIGNVEDPLTDVQEGKRKHYSEIASPEGHSAMHE